MLIVGFFRKIFDFIPRDFAFAWCRSEYDWESGFLFIHLMSRGRDFTCDGGIWLVGLIPRKNRGFLTNFSIFLPIISVFRKFSDSSAKVEARKCLQKSDFTTLRIFFSGLSYSFLSLSGSFLVRSLCLSLFHFLSLSLFFSFSGSLFGLLET